jgi:hypothetical protein
MIDLERTFIAKDRVGDTGNMLASVAHGLPMEIVDMKQMGKREAIIKRTPQF